MIIIARSLVLSKSQELGPNNPVIGWRNLVTADNVAADTEATGFPVTNLANQLTFSLWRADDDSEQYLTVSLDFVGPIDSVGIAGHNFGSAGIAPSIEGFDGDDWVELVEQILPADDAPLLFRFPLTSMSAIRVKLPSGDAPPEAAILYVGPLLVLQRRIYVGHTPIPFGRRPVTLNGRSAGGHYLGEIVTSSWLQSGFTLNNITPGWYREHLDPFIKVARKPFFFAWRPGTYPKEVGWVWATNDPQPVNSRRNGMMQISLELTGIA